VHGSVKYRLKNQKSTLDEDDEETEVELSVCPDCQGTRLRKEALSVLFHGKNIGELSEISVDELLVFFSKLKLSSKENLVGEKILKQINGRLSYLVRVGTGYLSLSRTARTLSGGEAQRIRLATQVGSSLIGVLYVMDEPSIGLHPRDHARMLEIIRELRDRGNTILLVEHDEETMLSADYLIDLGPGAGKLGGALMAEGTPQQVMQNPNSVTGGYLSGRLKIAVPKNRRLGNGKFLEIKKASGNNLKKVDVKIPLGTLTVVTGVSGSGKSTLVIDTLYKAMAQKLNDSSARPSPYEAIVGAENVDRVIEINQHPIGRTPRSSTRGVRVTDVEPQRSVSPQRVADVIEDGGQRLHELFDAVFETDLSVDPVVAERPVGR
jgi:excinuclease ABC subunit A